MPQTEIKPLGIDLRLKDRQSPDGLCSDIRELRPIGYVENPIWKAIPVSENLHSSPGSTIRSAIWHDRTRRGFLSTDDTSTLDRIVLVYDDAIKIKDTVANTEDASYSIVGLGSFVECHFEQFNEVLFLSVLGTNKLVQVVIIDDSIFEYQTPPLPNINITPIQDSKGLSHGEYGIRCAWRYGDGIHGPLSTPQLLVLDENDAPNDKWTFSIGAFATNEIQAFFANGFDKVVAGLTIFITQKTPQEILGPAPDLEVIQEAQSAVEWVHNTQYYELSVLDFKYSDVTSQFIFSFTYEELGNDEIVSRTQANEDVMPHLQIGKVLTSFNQRFIHGVTTIDFAKPLPPKPINDYTNLPTDPGAGNFTLVSVTYTEGSEFNSWTGGSMPFYQTTIVITHVSDAIIGLFQSDGVTPLANAGGWTVAIDGTQVTAVYKTSYIPVLFPNITIVPKTASNSQNMTINLITNYP